MAVRLREIPWASQPQEFAGIDWTHPAARGLVGAWVPTQGPGNLAITGGSRLFVPASVEASRANLAGRYSGQISSDSAVTNAAALGFAIGLRTGTAAVQSVVLSRGSGNAQFAFHASHSNSSYAGAVYSGAGFTIIGKPTGAALADNTRYDIGARIAASNGAVYSGGVKTATNASAAAPGTSSAGLYFASDSTGGNTWTADPWIEYLFIWNIAPEDWVFKEVAANPWQIFEPQRIWFPVAAGGGSSLTPGVAALTLSGPAPTLAQTTSSSLTPGAGALTLAGPAPTVAQTTSSSLTPGALALTLAGPAPTVSQTSGLTVIPAAAALTLAGPAPTVAQSAHVSLTPAAAALTLAGPAPTVVRAGNVSVTPGAAALALATAAPTVAQTTGNTLAPAAATLSLAGPAPTVVRTTNVALSPAPATLTIATYLASLSAGIIGPGVPVLVPADDLVLAVAAEDMAVAVAAAT